MGEFNQRFNSFSEWADKASSWLTRHPMYDGKSFRAYCYDARGRRVWVGEHFERAQSEKAFPVRWFWPDQDAERTAFLRDCLNTAAQDPALSRDGRGE